MSDFTLLEMWGPIRRSLIESHLFYVEQAHKRLLSQFDKMEEEAEMAADEWLEQSDQHFDPDRHDPADFYEAANDASIEFYQLLSDMRDQTRFSVVAGMFHQWEKQLRDWLVRETRHWHRGDMLTSKIWSVDLGRIFDLFEGFGWGVRGESFYTKIDSCRLVVNVYKHGEGNSFVELKQKYTEYLYDPIPEFRGISDKDYLDHTHLALTDEQLQAFSESIVEFWQKVPERILESQVISVPDWFEKAVLKDREAYKNKNKNG